MILFALFNIATFIADIRCHLLYDTVCRELYPSLLKKGDRGKHHNPAAQPAAYGQKRVADAVEGVELLEAYEKGEIQINSDGTCATICLCCFIRAL